MIFARLLYSGRRSNDRRVCFPYFATICTTEGVEAEVAVPESQFDEFWLLFYLRRAALSKLIAYELLLEFVLNRRGLRSALSSESMNLNQRVDHVLPSAMSLS
jgi:hypothetical protein